jgi:glycosyltransferase involved in cell wall biosynthesis
MTTPRLSIVIPCRNAEPHVGRCISSALAQTRVDKEVLVVDDGSSDSSWNDIQSFGAEIRAWQQPQRGGNAARNAGLTAARGEWIQFLDADDYLEPDKVVRQLDEAGDAASVADVLYSPVWIETWKQGRGSRVEGRGAKVEGRGSRVEGRKAGVQGREAKGEEQETTGGLDNTWRAIDRLHSTLDPALDLFCQWISWQLPQTGGALWRKSALQRIGGWKEGQPCCQEHELYLRAMQAGLRFHYCPSPGAVYRIWSEDTVCRRDPLLVIREKTALIDAMMDWLRVTGKLQRSHQHCAGQACFEMARSWAKYAPSAAARYFHERRQQGLIRTVGPAAPIRYRLALRLLGFVAAERLAGMLR